MNIHAYGLVCYVSVPVDDAAAKMRLGKFAGERVLCTVEQIVLNNGLGFSVYAVKLSGQYAEINRDREALENLS
ncbi:MAG TPA: hypothetical protein VN039_07845 [Nitrospira sp.]|nr:hypothetical protein [Nitrospira sp.]